MKIVDRILFASRVIFGASLGAFIVTCAFWAYQSDPDKVQREIDKSPGELQNKIAKNRVERPSPSEEVQRAIDESPRIAPNSFHKIMVPCWPICADNQQSEREINEYIVDLNNAQSIKKVVVDEVAFRRAMNFSNNNQLVIVR
jgi:hypothetical protein